MHCAYLLTLSEYFKAELDLDFGVKSEVSLTKGSIE